MFESLNQRYEDFCWWQIEDDHLKESLRQQLLNEIGSSSDLFLIKDNLVAVAKSDRQDDVLFSDGNVFYVVHLSWSDHHFDGCPRYKLLKQNELMDYMEWYHNNI